MILKYDTLNRIFLQKSARKVKIWTLLLIHFLKNNHTRLPVKTMINRNDSKVSFLLKKWILVAVVRMSILNLVLALHSHNYTWEATSLLSPPGGSRGLPALSNIDNLIDMIPVCRKVRMLYDSYEWRLFFSTLFVAMTRTVKNPNFDHLFSFASVSFKISKARILFVSVQKMGGHIYLPFM